MGRKVDVDDLIGANEVAAILELAHRNSVAEYQRNRPDMPRPVIDLGKGQPKLWLRQEIERWNEHKRRAKRPDHTRKSASR